MLMQVSPAAQTMLQSLFSEKEQAVFRVFIMGGGCSGFEYEFELGAEISDDDWQIPVLGGHVVVDPMSWTYLSQATLDHEKSLMGTRFIVHNPLVKKTCGCGASFSL